MYFWTSLRWCPIQWHSRQSSIHSLQPQRFDVPTNQVQPLNECFFKCKADFSILQATQIAIILHVQSVPKKGPLQTVNCQNATWISQSCLGLGLHNPLGITSTTNSTGFFRRNSLTEQNHRFSCLSSPGLACCLYPTNVFSQFFKKGAVSFRIDLSYPISSRVALWLRIPLERAFRTRPERRHQIQRTSGKLSIPDVEAFLNLSYNLCLPYRYQTVLWCKLPCLHYNFDCGIAGI